MEQMDIFSFLPKTCESCKYFFHYTCGPGDIYHGTACGINWPLSKDVFPDQEACKDWIERRK